ncbi:MAG: dipeptidase [Burkholderiales bacterium]
MNAQAIAQQDALERARQLHREHIVIDSLAPGFVSERVLTPPMAELARRLQAEGKKRSAIKSTLADYLLERCATDAGTREAYMAYWNSAGVTACSNTMYSVGPPDSAWEVVQAEFDRAGRMLKALGGAVVAVGSAAEIERVHKEGRRAVFYNVQNAEPFGDKLDRVDVLHGMGLRVVQLTNNLRNRFGEGCLEKNDGGLSRLGEALVHRLNARGMLVDVSHGSAGTGRDAALSSAKPIISSHTSARALSGHARGTPDDVLKAIADRGGYVGVVTLPAFLLPATGDDRAAKAGKPAGWATLDAVVDHIEYLLNLIGAEHVGIGTDWAKPYYSALQWSPAMVTEQTEGFNWVGWRPQDRFDPNMQVVDLETWDQWPNLTAAMLRRGIPEATVIKVIGGNFLRVFREVCG